MVPFRSRSRVSFYTQNVAISAPTPMQNVMCNLYEAVFSNLFDGFLNGVAFSDLSCRTYRVLCRDFPEYERFVLRVVNHAVAQSVFPAHTSGSARGPRAGGKP